MTALKGELCCIESMMDWRELVLVAGDRYRAERWEVEVGVACEKVSEGILEGVAVGKVGFELRLGDNFRTK